jgi:hypothetical protein
VEVREDPRHLGVPASGPDVLRVGQTDARIDERPAILAG